MSVIELFLTFLLVCNISRKEDLLWDHSFSEELFRFSLCPLWFPWNIWGQKLSRKTGFTTKNNKSQFGISVVHIRWTNFVPMFFFSIFVECMTICTWIYHSIMVQNVFAFFIDYCVANNTTKLFINTHIYTNDLKDFFTIKFFFLDLKNIFQINRKKWDTCGKCTYDYTWDFNMSLILSGKML